MLQHVTLEDYAYDAVRRVLADPDPWSEVFFDPSRIKDAPTDSREQRKFAEEFVEVLRALRPDWVMFQLDDDPYLCISMATRGLHELDLWQWIQIRKRDMY